jgi:hypothetical protein
MAAKGLVFEVTKNGVLKYSLADPMFTFLRASGWPDEPNKAYAEMASEANKYFMDGWWEQFRHTHRQGLRTLPIDKTIEDKRTVLSFEDVVKVIQEREYYTVSNCPCRHRFRADPDSEDCTHLDEVCLHFDDLGRYTVANGIGREISYEETLEILKKAADDGLVHGISNWEDQPDTV